MVAFVFLLLCLLRYTGALTDLPPCDLRVASSYSSPERSSDVETVATLHDAADFLADAAGAVLNYSDFVICIDSGMHLLGGQPLRLNGTQHNLRGAGRVVWRGAGASNTTISAGSALGNWTRCDDGIQCPWPEYHDVLWVHRTVDIFPPLPSAASSPIRQLWVNGIRATRTFISAAKTLGLTPTATGYVAASALPATLTAEIQVELRWPMQIQNWIEPRCVVSAVSGNQITVSPACWSALIARNGGKLPPAPTFAENWPADPPGPGEFFATSEYIFFHAVNAHEAPVRAWTGVGDIIAADGVRNHTWTSVGFAHGTWRQPNAFGGYVPSQSAVTAAAGEPVGAVGLSRARNVSFEDCRFSHIGAAYALSIEAASQGIVVQGCSFNDLSGGALKLGNVNDTRSISTDVEEWDVDILVSRNTIQNVALEFRGASAIFAGYVARTTIQSNTIENTGYTAISLGWGWGAHVKGSQTFAADNHVLRNRITGVMLALNDGGCTYTLGPQPRSSIEGNYCSADRARVVGCFYHDNGSRFFTTRNNVAEGSPAPCVYLQGCCNSPAYDIAVSELWCRDVAPAMNGCETENCTIDQASLYYVGSKVAWPAEAQMIIQMAGAGGVGTS